MELRRYGAIALRWWWLFLASALLAGGVAWYVSSLQPKLYRASTLLLINQTRGIQGIDYNSVILSQRLAATYAELITQPPVLNAAATRLGLRTAPGDLNRQVQVKVVRDTQLLELSVENRDPNRARDLANAIAEVFVSQRVADQVGSNAPTREVLRQQTESLRVEMTNTAQALERAKGSEGAAADSAEVTRLQGLLAQQQITYAQLLRDQSEMALAEAQAATSVKVAVPAEAPKEPVSPNVPRNALLAAVIGLMLALGAVFLYEYLDDTVKSEADIQAAAELSTLAIIARAPGKPTEGPRLFDESAGHSALGEAYRALRANVDFAWAGEPGQVILVTSANPREGKSTTAANLGAVLAEDNRRVILVDADLRRPSLHKTFGVSVGRGLTNLLADPNASVANYIVPTRRGKLSVLASGPIPPNPSELLGSARFGEVLNGLRSLADIVLIDTPPALGIIDAAVAATRADGVIVVAEAGRTRSEALERTIEVLSRTPARLLGVALNKVGERSAGHYYYYYRRYYAEGTTPLDPSSPHRSSPNGKLTAGPTIGRKTGVSGAEEGEG